MRKEILFIIKILILLCAIAVFFGLILFPQTEGRAVGLDLVNIYTDPLIIYIFFASIPFFIILSQLYKLLNLFEINKIYSKQLEETLNIIKIASFLQISLIALALIYIRFFVKGDDPASPTMLGIIAISIFTFITITSIYFQKKLSKM